MAVTVRWDILKQVPQAVQETFTWDLERIAMVHGLDPTVGRPKQALAAKAAAGVEVGQTLDTGNPLLTPALERISFDFDPEANHIVYVKCLYKARFGISAGGEYDIEVGTACVQEETDHDVNGNSLSVFYKPPSGTEDEQKVLAPVYIPCSRIRISRTELGSPANKSRMYTGKVNSGGWSLDLAATPATWLVNAITGRSKDRINYQVEYDLIQKPKYAVQDIDGNDRGGWDTMVFYLDKRGHLPKDDTNSPSKRRMFYVLKDRIDFNGMDL